MNSVEDYVVIIEEICCERDILLCLESLIRK